MWAVQYVYAMIPPDATRSLMVWYILSAAHQAGRAVDCRKGKIFALQVSFQQLALALS
jgi:hypothetical protein